MQLVHVESHEAPPQAVDVPHCISSDARAVPGADRVARRGDEERVARARVFVVRNAHAEGCLVQHVRVHDKTRRRSLLTSCPVFAVVCDSQDVALVRLSTIGSTLRSCSDGTYVSE